MIQFVEISIVDHCNLNCAKCCHFTPLVSEPKFKNLEDFRREIVRLKDIVHPDSTINLLGGEPLLHPQFIDFVKVVHENFPGGFILITTNGILLNKIPDKDIAYLNSITCQIAVSKYPINLDLSSVLPKFKNIEVIPITEMYTISLDLSGSHIPAEEFNICDQAYHNISHEGLYGYGCIALKDGYLYPCSLSANICDFEKHFHTNMTEFHNVGIDIFRHSAEEIEEYLSKPHDCCKYCDVKARGNSLSSEYKHSTKNIREWVN